MTWRSPPRSLLTVAGALPRTVGTAHNPAPTSADLGAFKLAPDGTEVWTTSLNGDDIASFISCDPDRFTAFNDNGRAVALTSDGDVVVAGSMQLRLNCVFYYAFKVQRLTVSSGESMWLPTTAFTPEPFVSIGNSPDGVEAFAVAVDSHGDVIAAGVVPEQMVGGRYLFGVVKISGALGTEIWTTRLGESLVGTGVAPDIVIDSNDDVIVVGTTNVIHDSAGGANGVFTVAKLRGTDGRVFAGCTDPFSNTCGDDEVCAPETCDDGNVIDGDGCDSNCTPTGCGNNVTTPPEQCDDGNLTAGDGCSAACVAEPRCGDGHIDPGEECDDGNASDGDGCDGDCKCSDGFGLNTGTLIPPQQRKRGAANAMKAPKFDPAVGPTIGGVAGRITTFHRFPRYPSLGAYTHEAFIPMDKVDAINDVVVNALRVKLDGVFGDRIAGILADLGIGFLTDRIFDILKLSLNGNDRGHDPNFSPGACKASVVLAFERGTGWIMMNYTTAIGDVDVPPIGPTVHLFNVSRTAIKARERWKMGDWSWFWADWVDGDTFRLRYELRLAVPLLPVGDLSNGFLAAIDHQIFIDRRTGAVTFEGDAFPSTGTYRYKCSSHAQTMDRQFATDPGALAVERDFSIDHPVNATPNSN